MPAERSLYRTLERVGKYFPVLLDRHQNLVAKHGLVDPNQLIDFSSTYFEGRNSALGEFGYSRDHRPGKLQINFGIATGINTIPQTKEGEHLQEAHPAFHEKLGGWKCSTV